jgi:Contractile injection system tube protein
MPDSVKLEKAQLWELEPDFKSEKDGGKRVTVQFNPETLKVSFANQIATPEGAGDQKGTPARQFVGAGTTKLALQLWFDVSSPLSEAATPEGETAVTDVRKLTQEVAYFITPIEEGKKFVPPAVRFLWGSFQFEGIMDSLEESLEFFSSEGKPLRASMSLSLSQQKITKFTFRDTGSSPAAGATPPAGTKPMTQAPANSTLQGLASNQGRGNLWQIIAELNGIENPRLLQPGQLIDMDVSASAPSASFGINTQTASGPGPSVGVGTQIQGR